MCCQSGRDIGRLGRRQRKKLGAWRERDVPASAVEVSHPALASLDPNVAWTEQLAQELGLDMMQFGADMTGEGCMDWLRNGYRSLSDLGVNGTPAFYVNGRFVSGAQPFSIFKALIDQELAKANKVISSGTSVADYYKSEVVDKGRKEL